MARTFFRSAVLILAVVERPGRKLSGGFSNVMTTLKSLASCVPAVVCVVASPEVRSTAKDFKRSEEHTSELQSLRHLVCRLLLEKKKMNKAINRTQPRT